jgi:hypothetical protein
MSIIEDSFKEMVSEDLPAESAEVTCKPPGTGEGATRAGTVTARLHAFDFDEQPLLIGVPDLPDELVPARTTVPLLQAHIGSTVVLLFEHGDPRLPIIVGVLQQPYSSVRTVKNPSKLVSVQMDDRALLLTAEREIVLRCGDASITLTRAGKVLIKGKYLLSRSSGYNKIKGAAVDIN